MKRERKIAICAAFVGLVVFLSAWSYRSFERQNIRRNIGLELVHAATVSTNAVLQALRNGGYINRRCDARFGWTPLIAAINHHQQEVIDFLLASGADPNLSDGQFQQTPLCWAINGWASNTFLIRSLVDHGANPEIRDARGANAFDYTRSKPNSVELVELLGEFNRKTK